LEGVLETSGGVAGVLAFSGEDSSEMDIVFLCQLALPRATGVGVDNDSLMRKGVPSFANTRPKLLCGHGVSGLVRKVKYVLRQVPEHLLNELEPLGIRHLVVVNVLTSVLLDAVQHYPQSDVSFALLAEGLGEATVEQTSEFGGRDDARCLSVIARRRISSKAIGRETGWNIMFLSISKRSSRVAWSKTCCIDTWSSFCRFCSHRGQGIFFS
jgi:hypothetical protein